jgi:hypothetical protein
MGCFDYVASQLKMAGSDRELELIDSIFYLHSVWSNPLILPLKFNFDSCARNRYRDIAVCLRVSQGLCY